jgi:hypothetical protein
MCRVEVGMGYRAWSMGDIANFGYDYRLYFARALDLGYFLRFGNIPDRELYHRGVKPIGVFQI